MGSTPAEEAIAAAEAVLIPSSSGHGFNHRGRRRVRPLGRVLIPSSSGHGFNRRRRRGGDRRRRGLNPFFIRAWVQPFCSTADRYRSAVLIPSSSGHGFNRDEQAYLPYGECLNPFFIRAWVQPGRAGIPPLWGVS